MTDGERLYPTVAEIEGRVMKPIWPEIQPLLGGQMLVSERTARALRELAIPPRLLRETEETKETTAERLELERRSRNGK